MDSSRSLFAVPLLLLGACDGSAPVEAVAPSAGEPHTFDLALDPARALRGYSFDGGAVVPWFGQSPPQRIPFGELGRTPLTRLYLTFEPTLETEVGVQPGGWTFSGRAAQPGTGRYGKGCALGASSLLSFTLPEAQRKAGAWTIELWLRTAEIERRDVLALSGLLTLALNENGRLVAAVPGATYEERGETRALQIFSAAPLRAGEWNHVGVVLDLQDTRTLRVVLNGEPQTRAFAGELPAAAPEQLLLGDAGGTGRGIAGEIDELRLQARAANTAELEEHWRAAPQPLEHLRLDYADGSEELELWSAPLTEPRVETEDQFARGALAHVVAGPEGLAWAAGNWRRILALDPPVARTTHPTVYVGDHQLFTFSGETRDTHGGKMMNTQDTWLFDTQKEIWTRLDTPLAPHGRCHQAAAYSPEHDLVLYAGGFENDMPEKKRFSDTWVFHVRERRWEERHPAGFHTGLVSDCGVVYHAGAKCFVVFTGARIMTYDPSADRWDLVPAPAAVDAQGRPASYTPGGSVIAGYDPRTQRILLFGGAVGPGDTAEYIDDCAFYDLATNRFTRLDSTPRPSPRVRSGFAWDPRRSRFVLFGGVLGQDSERKRDLWTFDPDTSRWTQELSANLPTRRGGYYGMGYDPELDRFFLLCGRHSKERFLEDAWTLELDASVPGTARYLFDRAGFAQRTAWFAESDAPQGSAVTVRFRASADGRRFEAWSDSCPDGARFVEVELTLSPGKDGAAPHVRALGFRDPV